METIKIQSIKDSYKQLAQQTRKVFSTMGIETTTDDTENKTTAPQPEEEKVTVGSLLQYLHVATDQTDTLLNELLTLFKGVDFPNKQKDIVPANILDSCVNLADKIITIRNKVQELKSTVA